MGRYAAGKKGTLAIAFGTGLLFALICPPQSLITLLALALIFLGIITLKC